MHDRTRRSLNQYFGNLFRNNLDWIQQTSFTNPETGRGITGGPLYKHLFGNHLPVETTLKYSHKAEVVRKAMEEKGNYLFLPEESKYIQKSNCMSLGLRYDPATKIEVYMRLPLPNVPLPKFSSRLFYVDSTTSQHCRIIFRHHWAGIGNSIDWNGTTPDCTHAFFAPHLLEAYGQDFLTKIEHIVGFYDSLNDLDDGLDKYMQNCASVAGLFQKLPVLSSFAELPKTPDNHVRFTRNTPAPPEKLVNQLNMLVSVDSARRAALAKK